MTPTTPGELPQSEREAFEAVLAALPAAMQATIRDSMTRSESNSWTFFKAGYQAAIAAKPQEAEVTRLRQALWDVYAALGFDTDGDKTPAALVSDIAKLVTDAAKEFRANYDEAIAQPQQAVPGYVLVPVEPTEAMLANVDEEVGGHCHSCTKWRASDDDCRRIFAALIQAAPPAPSVERAATTDLAVLVLELAEAVDNAVADIGGSRPQLDILREAVQVAHGITQSPASRSKEAS